MSENREKRRCIQLKLKQKTKTKTKNNKKLYTLKIDYFLFVTLNTFSSPLYSNKYI